MTCVTVTPRASEVNPEFSLCLPAVSPAMSSCDAGQYADVKQLLCFCKIPQPLIHMHIDQHNKSV